jgi:GNAT superfamily N-acetyltransferase
MKKINVTNMDIELREGTVEDVPLLLSFIRKMAEFERIDCTATEAVLEESLFGDRPAAATLLAFVEGHPIAYAVYFLTFATMVGKRGLWLDDLFVDPEFRGKGVAKAMMAYLADIAIENKCGRFEWIVLDWNKTAIGFYNKLGAKILDDWRICRLDEGKFEG